MLLDQYDFQVPSKDKRTLASQTFQARHRVVEEKLEEEVWRERDVRTRPSRT